MHRSLRLEALSLLPISIRRFAIPAANGSADDLDRLLRLVANDDLRYTQCLPALDANLDPERIPGEENLNTEAVKCANSALYSLVTLTHAPKYTWPDLWPRVWAWIVFFEAYRECLVEPFARPHVCFDLVRFVRAFNDDEPTKTAIRSTVGWRPLVMQAWSMILEFENPQAHYAFPDLCSVIRGMNIDSPGGFEEVLDGAQGAHNLGYLVMRSIRILTNEKDIDDISDEDLVFLTDILLFLQTLGNEETISPALMANGGATDITWAAIAGYNHRGGADRKTAQQTALLLCINALVPMLSCHRAMRDALAAGLVNCIIYGAIILPNARDPAELRGLKHIVTQALPGSTVFQSVLVELDIRLQQFRHISESADLEISWMYDDWRRFLAIADDRIALMKAVQSKDFIPFKACDNMDCGVIRPRGELKRCSHCQQVYYCSISCQTVDWGAGGHREACHSIRVSSFKNKDIGTRNLQFMRQLLHRDLIERRSSKNLPVFSPSRVPHLRELAQTSQSDPFITVVDYGFRDSPRLALEGISRLRDIQSLPIHWEEYIARMTRSHGRMELHLMIVPEGFTFSGSSAGPQVRYLMFPQRSERPAFHESVRRLFHADGSNVQEDHIRRLLIASDNYSSKVRRRQLFTRGQKRIVSEDKLTAGRSGLIFGTPRLLITGSTVPNKTGARSAICVENNAEGPRLSEGRGVTKKKKKT
ncbi:hypothetical protein C8R45DRAFT_1075151 [Mycena sanguinolenta]|nr:hypothetical protein C8R45DRAFT_1075151 [Mycena sanguinolenta]